MNLIIDIRKQITKPIKRFKPFGFTSLKGNKSIVITNAFQKLSDTSKCKLNKTLVIELVNFTIDQ